MGDNNESKDIDLQTKDKNDDDLKKQLWKRFRPKRWISSIWKKYSLETKMNDVKTFLKINIVPAVISVAMGMCYLVLKSKGSKCKVVPYSELLKGVKDGRVTRVQFKENSGRIMYNSKPPSSVESAIVVKKATNATFKVQDMWISMLSKLSKKHEVLPESKIGVADRKSRELVTGQVPKHGWQFSTRMIDDDYRELLSLMKQKGTTYGIVPEPFLVSTGKKVFSTVLNQAPSWAMLYLVSHGLGGGGASIARKPSKDDTVTFDDVEGVDEAKAELMEVTSIF